VRGKLMMAHGLAMLTLGFALLYIRATMTNLFFYVFGGAFSLLLVAASLLFIAGIDWICATGLGRHQVSRLRGLLFLSTGVAACSLLIVFYPGATIRMICWILALYALALSVGKLSLARYWRGTQRKQRLMFALAGLSLAFSGTLAAVAFAGADDRAQLAAIAGYALFMGFQMLLTMYFLQQQGLGKVEQARV
jgi:hypothetical protein